MINILHFISDTNIGGAGNLLYNQISSLDNKRFSITVALPHNSELIKKIRDLPCRIVKCKYGENQSFSLESVIESYEIIKKIRPDIVHSHGSLSSRIAATLLHVPCRVFTRHCAPSLPKIMHDPLVKTVIGTAQSLLSTAMIATADCAKQNLIDMGCNNKKIITVINGVPPLRPFSDIEKEFLRTKYGLTKDDFVISYFARLNKGKGHKTLLRAAKVCQKYYPNFRFFVVGSGPYENQLKNYARYLGVDDIVKFIGFCADVSPIFNITDINVNCSYISETSSLSLSEGMSIGIPSVASDIGGNTYMIKNAQNGLIYPSQNSDALAMAIIRLYRDKNLYKKCSHGALIRYNEELNDRIMCQKMTEFYLREYRKSKNKHLAKHIHYNRL